MSKLSLALHAAALFIPQIQPLLPILDKIAPALEKAGPILDAAKPVLDAAIERGQKALDAINQHAPDLLPFLREIAGEVFGDASDEATEAVAIKWIAPSQWTPEMTERWFANQTPNPQAP